jgi:hypothetical protein
MTEEHFYTLVMGVAALFGAVVGRIIALEAEDRRTAVLAAGYCGAGAGLVSAVPSAFLLALVVKLWSAELSAAGLIDAVEATGPALLWGPAGGAAGGLALGIVVAVSRRGFARDP